MIYSIFNVSRKACNKSQQTIHRVYFIKQTTFSCCSWVFEVYLTLLPSLLISNALHYGTLSCFCFLSSYYYFLNLHWFLWNKFQICFTFANTCNFFILHILMILYSLCASVNIKLLYLCSLFCRGWTAYDTRTKSNFATKYHS